ncbi:MAG: thiol:disulfide interchange protein DsbA/DsbL [Dokdonella sp.]
MFKSNSLESSSLKSRSFTTASAQILALAMGAVLTVAGAHAQPLAPSPGAAPANSFVVGKDYFLIEPVQTTPGSDKVEVTEVFSYGCPACNSFAPTANKLKASLPPNATFNLVPASFNSAESWPLFQRAYLTAKALGIAEKGHDAMFKAVWDNGPLSIRDAKTGKMLTPKIEDVAAFYSQYGVKAEDFVATANSFAINTGMKRADAFIKATGVDSTPTIIVNGKYRVTGSSAGNWDRLIELVNHLVRQESEAHSG